MTMLMTQRCDIVKQVETTFDSVGRPSGYTETDVFATVRCRLDPLRHRSYQTNESGAKQGIYKEMIYTEWRTGVTTDMQIVLEGRLYNIVSVNEISLSSSVGHHLEIEVDRSDNA